MTANGERVVLQGQSDNTTVNSGHRLFIELRLNMFFHVFAGPLSVYELAPYLGRQQS